MTTSTLTKPKRSQTSPVRDRTDLPFGSYGRISKRKAGDGGGATIKIERQHEENRATLVGVFGPDVKVVEYGDNMSAWNPDVVRPGWVRMLKDLREGKLRGVIAWHADRFTRQPLQLEMLLDEWKRARCHLLTTRSGLITDPTMIRIEGALAAKESDQKSARNRLHHDGLARDGKPHGGRRRFGFEPNADGTMLVRESEAVVVRELVDRLLTGESLSRLARDLTAREIPAPAGGRWTAGRVGAMLRKPAYAGLREHRDPETGDVSTTPAVWDEIIPLDKHQRVLFLLGDPTRRKATSSATVHLLAGLAKCETCGGKLRGKRTKAAIGEKRRSYICETGRHCQRSADQMDTIVERRVIDKLTQMTLDGLISPSDPGHGEAEQLTATIAELTQAIEQAKAKRTAGRITMSRYLDTVGDIDDEIASCEARLQEIRATAARPADVLEGMTGEGAAEAWHAADLGRQRAILDLLCEIRLRGSNGDRAAARQPLSPRDVLIDWQDDADDVEDVA